MYLENNCLRKVEHLLLYLSNCLSFENFEVMQEECRFNFLMLEVNFSLIFVDGPVLQSVKQTLQSSEKKVLNRYKLVNRKENTLPKKEVTKALAR